MSDVEELEDEYQVSKLLSQDLSVEVEIVDLGVIERDYSEMIVFELRDASDRCFVIKRPLRGTHGQEDHIATGFVQLYNALEIRPQSDLNVLCGNKVTLSAENLDESGSDVSVGKNGCYMRAELIKNSSSLDEISQKALTPSLDQKTVADLNRVLLYTKTDSSSIELTIKNIINPSDGMVAIVLQDPYGKIHLQREVDHSDTEPSDYERVVERIGQGSVKQVIGSTIYLYPDITADYGQSDTWPEREDRLERTEPYVMHYSSEYTRWWVFHSKPSSVTVDREMIFTAILFILGGIGLIALSYNIIGLVLILTGAVSLHEEMSQL